MTEEMKEHLLTILFFLKGAKDEHLYFGGWSSQQAWESAARFTFNMSGEQLDKLLDTSMNKEKEAK